MSEDQAMAAFSDFTANGGGLLDDKPDPAKVAAEKKKKEDASKA